MGQVFWTRWHCERSGCDGLYEEKINAGESGQPLPDGWMRLEEPGKMVQYSSREPPRMIGEGNAVLCPECAKDYLRWLRKGTDRRGATAPVRWR